MNQDRPVINGLPASPVDPAQLQGAVQGTLAQAPQASAPALATFTAMQQRRATRINNVAAVLGTQVGNKNPDVVALQTLATNVTRLAATVQNQTTRAANWPKPRPNEWLVFGTVTDAKGAPASGLTVRVFDKDRKYDDLLGETETDANGDFSVIYHERDFKESHENLPDLYVMVSDASGKLLYSSRDSVRYEAGRSEYFAIRLGTKRTPAPPKTRAPRKPDADDKTRVSRKPRPRKKME